MSASVTWTGLEELKTDLQNMPAELADEGSQIVLAAANAAKTDIAAAYPKRTGKMRNSLTVTTRWTGRFGTRATLKNTHKRAREFELGTQARHTSLGANRGRMPPGNVFVPRVLRARHAMYDALKAMLERHGLIVSVSGDG